MASSSEIIDLPLVTVRAPARGRCRAPSARASSAVLHQCTWPPARSTFGPGFQVEIEIGQGVVLDVAADLAQALEFRQRGDGGGAARGEGGAGEGERLLQAGVGQRARGVFLEGGAGGEHLSRAAL